MIFIPLLAGIFSIVAVLVIAVVETRGMDREQRMGSPRKSFGYEEKTVKKHLNGYLPASESGIGSIKSSRRIEKSPWDRKVIIPISLLVNFGAGGIIAGINWRRMGKDHLAWPTIIVSIVGFIIWLLVPWAEILPDPSKIGPLQIGVGGLVGWLLWSWQKKTYEAWKDSHPEAKPAGWSVPLLVFVIFLFIQLLFWAPSILAR